MVPDGISQEDLERYLMAYVKTFTGDFQGQHLFRWIRDRRWEEREGETPPTDPYRSLRGLS